jgi:hypothetical protein
MKGGADPPIGARRQPIGHVPWHLAVKRADREEAPRAVVRQVRRSKHLGLPLILLVFCVAMPFANVVRQSEEL